MAALIALGITSSDIGLFRTKVGVIPLKQVICIVILKLALGSILVVGCLGNNAINTVKELTDTSNIINRSKPPHLEKITLNQST